MALVYELFLETFYWIAFYIFHESNIKFFLKNNSLTNALREPVKVLTGP